jgi:hypothetical protein
MKGTLRAVGFKDLFGGGASGDLLDPFFLHPLTLFPLNLCLVL